MGKPWRIGDRQKALNETNQNITFNQGESVGSNETMTNLDYQSKTISGPKNVSYDAQLRPIIVKSPSAPSAEATHQIINRQYEEVKSSCPDSQTLKTYVTKAPILN
jgi:hypothetical protein